jgi:hypothetical protein
MGRLKPVKRRKLAAFQCLVCKKPERGSRRLPYFNAVMPEYGVGYGDVKIEMGHYDFKQIMLAGINDFLIVHFYRDRPLFAAVNLFNINALQKRDGLGDPGLQFS